MSASEQRMQAFAELMLDVRIWANKVLLDESELSSMLPPEHLHNSETRFWWVHMMFMASGRVSLELDLFRFPLAERLR